MEPPEPPQLTNNEQALLDQLGDVFLTEDRRRSGLPSGDADEPRDGDPPSPQHARHDDHPLQGPPPIRLGPKLRTHPTSKAAPQAAAEPHPGGEAGDGASVQQDSPQTESHANPSAIGHRPSETSAGHRSPVTGHESTHHSPLTTHPPQATPELVFLGNLPGLAGPWLTQYAQLVADQSGPVALVHLDDDAAEIELVEPGDASLAAAARTTRFVAGEDGLDPATLLDALVTRDDEPVRDVLIHAEATDDPATLARYVAVDDWTLLTGSDDAAVVAGFTALKRMLEAEPRAKAVHLGVMVMGSDGEAARHAADKLARTAQPLLRHDVRRLGHHKQMAPVNVRQLGRFPLSDAAWAKLVDWLESLESPEAWERVEVGERKADRSEDQTADAVAESPTPSGEQEGGTPPEPVQAFAEPASVNEAAETPAEPAPAASASPAANQPSPTRPEPAPQSEIRNQKSEPANPSHIDNRQSAPAPPDLSPQPSAVSPEEEAPPSLADFLTAEDGALPGGIALDARCPDHPDIELLLDEDGRLHLLARHDSEADGPNADVQSVTLALMQARRWAVRHRELLRMTRRQLRFDDAATPRLHLFTDRADLATRLVAELDGEVRLHLLQEVTLGDASGWFCTPLG